MESNWKKHLESKGAVVEENAVIHYGSSNQELSSLTADNNTIVSDLSQNGIIKISGSEAQSFLQSQFSNDVNLVNESQAQLNSYCSPKGRALAFFSLFQIKADYYLQLPNDQLDSIQKRLTMFKMRADVDLEDVSDKLLSIGIAGSTCEIILKNHFDTIPVLNYETVTQNNLTLIRLNNETNASIQPRFLVFADSGTLSNFWDSHSDDLIPVTSAIWSLLDIQSGIPNITTETIDTFVPQMLNLQLINAVSFKKGCYPGQEIVARTQYLGKLKKRMYLLKSKHDQLISSGMDLTSENADDDQSKGKIVNCQLSTDGGIEALAVIQIKSTNQGQILTKQTPPVKFTIQELPYAFESTEAEN